MIINWYSCWCLFILFDHFFHYDKISKWRPSRPTCLSCHTLDHQKAIAHMQVLKSNQDSVTCLPTTHKVTAGWHLSSINIKPHLQGGIIIGNTSCMLQNEITALCRIFSGPQFIRHLLIMRTFENRRLHIPTHLTVSVFTQLHILLCMEICMENVYVRVE